MHEMRQDGKKTKLVLEEHMTYQQRFDVLKYLQDIYADKKLPPIPEKIIKIGRALGLDITPQIAEELYEGFVC